MTLLAVYARRDLALLATDTWIETRKPVPGVPPSEWPLLATGVEAKLEFCAAGWFAGTGVSSLGHVIALALRGLPTFADVSCVVREAGDRWLRDWEPRSPELAAHVRGGHHGLAPDGPTARVLDWRGADAFCVPPGRAAGSAPPGRIQRLLPGLLGQYTRSLDAADLDRAVRASARHVGAAIEACGSAGGVSDELEMGLFVAGSTGAWQPYYLPPTPWQYVASGEVRAEEVGPEGVRRTIVRRESMQA